MNSLKKTQALGQAIADAVTDGKAPGDAKKGDQNFEFHVFCFMSNFIHGNQ